MKRTKLTAEIRSIPEKGSVQGFIGERGKIVTENYPDGLEYFELRETAQGAPVRYWMTGGLRGAFTMANVAPGARVEIVHLGRVPFGDDGKTVNSYEIYGLED